MSGALSPGELLPTVRALARALGTSPATVSSAYRTLATRGLVIAEGRRGTSVAPRPPLSHDRAQQSGPDRPTRTRRERRTQPALRDLTVGLADPRLLPPLEPVLARVARMPRTPIDRLGGALDNLLWFARGWFAQDGIPAPSPAVLAGALDGLERVLAAHLRIGDRVLIEDPAYPPIRDLLLALGLVAAPVAVDEHGLVPAALAAGLARGASALVYVPRGQNPTGAALDADRAVALRAVLSGDPELLVIEDDHVSLVCGAPLFSAVDPARRRWAIVRALSKMLHPDLRIALVAGDETTIARVLGRQALGPRWVSHLLQETAATMLSDSRFQARCAAAADAYGERRRALIDALARQGIPSMGASGLNVWVPVPEEAAAVRGLAEAGFLVLAGERFRLSSPPAIRITISRLKPEDADQVAAALAAVLASSDAPRGRY